MQCFTAAIQSERKIKISRNKSQRMTWRRCGNDEHAWSKAYFPIAGGHTNNISKLKLKLAIFLNFALTASKDWH